MTGMFDNDTTELQVQLFRCEIEAREAAATLMDAYRQAALDLDAYRSELR